MNRAMRFSITFIGLLFLFSCASNRVQTDASMQSIQAGGIASINEKDLYHHMSFLASDEMQGRDTGDHSLEVAARYLARELESLNLKPVVNGNSYIQRYKLTRQAVSKESSLKINVDGKMHEFAFGESFISLPTRSSESQTIEGEVVFGGYGIYAPDFNYDSYDGIGAKDKIVIIMGSEPKDQNGKSIFDSTKASSPYAQFPAKMQAAMASGAKAFIIVPPPGAEGEQMLAQFEQIANFMARPRFSLPDGNDGPGIGGNMLAMFAKPEVAEAILAASGKTLAGLKEELDAQQPPKPFVLENVSAKVAIETDKSDIKVPNVMGLLEGSDPVLKEEVIVYTAHFDHVGVNDNGEIFNGADDDGSGTTAVLEIAEAFAQNPVRPKRSILFLWVSGEEKGLLGSRYYSDNPVIAMEKTVANINMDMVGRVRAADDTTKANEMLCLADDLFVVGGHQSSELKKLNEIAAAEIGIKIDYELNDLNHPERIYYRSDHYNFARKGVPVLFYTTGLHVDYHQPTDTIEKINFEKIKNVAALGYLTGWKVANQEKRIVVDNPLDLN